MSGLRLERIAFSAIPWFNLKADPSDPDSEDLWLLETDSFAGAYPSILAGIASAGFGAVPLEVLPSQATADFVRLAAERGLRVAPGYLAVELEPDGSAKASSSESARRFAERCAEAGVRSAFVAPALEWMPHAVRATHAAAVGHGFEADRLERVCDSIAESAQILTDSGIRAGLHNHVGTWIETEEEIERVLSRVSPDVLGASFDVGHLAWAGADPVAVVSQHRERIVDLHVKDLDLAVAAESRRAPHPYNWAPSRGLFRAPGDGDVDLDGVIAALPDNFAGWVVIEVDRTDLAPLESARRSRRWLSERAA